MAVRIPATGGTPDAPAIPRHSGKAIRKTRKPAVMSLTSVFGKPCFIWKRLYYENSTGGTQGLL